MPSSSGWSLRQYLSLRVTTTFSLSVQLTNFQAPAPTGLRSDSEPCMACRAFGENIMPARSERISTSAVSGCLSFSVTCSGPVTSTVSTDATSALRFERWSFLAAIEVELDRCGVQRRAVVEGHAGLELHHQRLRIGELPALAQAGLGRQRLVVPLEQRVEHRVQLDVVETGATGRRIERRGVARRRHFQDAALARRALRPCDAGQAGSRRGGGQRGHGLAPVHDRTFDAHRGVGLDLVLAHAVSSTLESLSGPAAGAGPAATIGSARAMRRGHFVSRASISSTKWQATQRRGSTSRHSGARLAHSSTA